MNLQPWRFLVVRESRNRRKLRDCTFGESRITEAPVVLIVLAYLHPDRTDLARCSTGCSIGRDLPRGRPENPGTATREWERNGGPTFRATRAAMLAAAP